MVTLLRFAKPTVSPEALKSLLNQSAFVSMRQGLLRPFHTQIHISPTGLLSFPSDTPLVFS